MFHWYEVCDAVQSEYYKIDGVPVSNFVLPLEVASVILLVAIIAAIALTLRSTRQTKAPRPERQVAVSRHDRVRLIKMAAEKPAAEPFINWAMIGGGFVTAARWLVQALIFVLQALVVLVSNISIWFLGYGGLALGKGVIVCGDMAQADAAIEEIKELHKLGRPVLVGTISIDMSEQISRLLKKLNVPHNVLQHHN